MYFAQFEHINSIPVLNKVDIGNRTQLMFNRVSLCTSKHFVKCLLLSKEVEG